VFPYVIYYNKKLFADNGLTDPRAMAEKSKWTWNVIRQMGKKVTDAGSNIYFLSNSFSAGRAVQLCYGAPVVAVDSKGNYKQNVTSEGYINANKFIQQLCVGNNSITEPNDTAHPYNSSETFMRGTAFMWTEETSKYLDIAKEVKTQSAFNRDKNNIGIVEMPLAGKNKNKYPTGWLTAVACGLGKDPKVSVAWDVFRSKYKDPVKDPNAMNAKDKEYTDDMLLGNIACEPASFADTETESNRVAADSIMPAIRNGADVAKTVADYKDKITACINFALK
jgi:ABC-type glycerol-3-phosphate transport system substrate-binding protein